MSGFEQNKQVNILVERYPLLDVVKDAVIAAYNIMEASYEKVGNFWQLAMEGLLRMRNTLQEN